MKRQHIFKKRENTFFHRPLKLRFGSTGLFSLKVQRFELVYLRGFKRMIRRTYIKRRMRFRYRKFWLFLRPNVILSSKSVNSRMGAGTGSLVRLAVNLKSYKSFVEFFHFSPFHLRKLIKWTRFKYPLKYTVVSAM